jgi:hypothetical protein
MKRIFIAEERNTIPNSGKIQVLAQKIQNRLDTICGQP